jgi:predicted Rossmann-fold nucleotide-binding protein
MIVGVMATSDEATTKTFCSSAKFVGALAASEGFDLLTGGGDGLMKVVGKEFLKTQGRSGKLISILRAKGTAHLTGLWDKKGNLYPNEVVDEEKLNEDMRKHMRNLVRIRSEATKRSWEANDDNGQAEILIRTHLPYSGGDLGEHDLSRNHINILTSDLIIILPGGGGTLSELKLSYAYDKPTAVFLNGGDVGGKNANTIGSEFGGVTVAQTEAQLRAWLLASRASLMAGKRHSRGRFV